MVHKYYYVKKNKIIRGFTLIEMMIAISVMIILTVIVVPIYQDNQKQLALQRAANKVVQDIRRTQDMAMSAREIINPYDAGERFVPEGGFGVYFGNKTGDKSKKYVIFAVCDGDNKKFINAGPPPCGTSPNNFSQAVETIDLEQGVVIDSFTFSSTHLNIVFTPPEPVTLLTDDSGATAPVATIALRSGTSFLSVVVLPSGLIYVQ